MRVGPNSPVRRQGRREPRGQGAATRRGHFDLPSPPANTFPEPAPEAPNGGAPLGAGGALLYDYRTVHCGSPNEGGGDEAAATGEAAELGEAGLRPILQLTYCRRGYRDRVRNYGYEQLWD